MSWEPVTDWYDDLVGDRGHYYHRQVILPYVLQKLSQFKVRSLCDLACGQGVLARRLPKSIRYLGIDIAPSLIEAAKERSEPHWEFMVGDVTNQALEIPPEPFDAVTLILAAQDLHKIHGTFQLAKKLLREGGLCIAIMTHPCFRIPQHSQWGVDEKKDLQYRRIDAYAVEKTIVIDTKPGEKESREKTKHHHRSLTFYMHAFFRAGFVLSGFDELFSDKQSTGKHQKREEGARAEFPLFLALVAKSAQL